MKAIHNQRLFVCQHSPSCELYTKIQKMKAIHNMAKSMRVMHLAVNYTQRYKKWKQFTTDELLWFAKQSLWTIHKDTKNESNSQPVPVWGLNPIGCELYTKIQKMKAIHNMVSLIPPESSAVNYTQRYKRWKQFTTIENNSDVDSVLWTIHKDTKNESNSQQD